MKDLKWIYTVEELNIENKTIKSGEVGQISSALDNEQFSILFLTQSEEIKVNKDLIIEFNPEETGDAYEKKICNECQILKDTIENFSANQTGKDNRIVRRPSCKSCRKKIDGRRIHNKNKKSEKKSGTRFDCPICTKTGIIGITSKIVLDHNHHDGKARGFICNGCNTALGAFRDDPEMMRTALAYLEGGKGII